MCTIINSKQIINLYNEINQKNFTNNITIGQNNVFKYVGQGFFED